MAHGFRRLLVGCCCAALTACGAPAEIALPSPVPSHVRLPKPAQPWDEDFAAHTELEEVHCSGRTIWLPEGLRIPEGTRIGQATEAAVVMADDDPSAVREAVERSAAAAGYALHHREGEVTVWVGRGMAVRLQARFNAQVLAWGPQDMEASFSTQ